MSEWSGVLDCFVTPIYNTVLQLNHTKISNYLLEQEKTLKSSWKNNVGGFESADLWQSHKDKLQEYGCFTEFEKHIKLYQDKVGLSDVKIERLWFSVMRYRDCVRFHSHNEAVICGTYYPQTPLKSGNIQFEHPAIDRFEVTWKERNMAAYNEYTGRLITPKVTVGRLLLYPGYLRHWVEPHLNETEARVALSFTCVRNEIIV